MQQIFKGRKAKSIFSNLSYQVFSISSRAYHFQLPHTLNFEPQVGDMGNEVNA
jgi:hypothetical protein